MGQAVLDMIQLLALSVQLHQRVPPGLDGLMSYLRTPPHKTPLISRSMSL